MLKLHPHHGLCLLFFEEKGYSDGFTAGMKQVKTKLAADGEAVLLTLSADVICAACPHDRGGECETAAQVRRYDEEVMRLCGLKEGQTVPFSELSGRCADRIVKLGLREQVCGDCCWSALCREVGARRFAPQEK